MTILTLNQPYAFVAIKHNRIPFFGHIKHYQDLIKEFGSEMDARDAEIIAARNEERDRWLGVQDAVAWIKSELTNGRPWQVLADRDVLKMNRSDAGLILILDEMNKIVGNAETPTEMIHMDRMMETLEMQVCRLASKELAAYEKSHDSTKGTRPSDLYRRWVLPLRWIIKNNLPTIVEDDGLLTESQKDEKKAKDLEAQNAPYRLAYATLRDLQLEATMPVGEMACPEWIDPYTGADDPTYNPADKKLAAKINKGVVYANESFDNEEEVFVAELEDSRSDWTEPVWQQAQKDGLPTDNLPQLQSEFYPLTQLLSMEIDYAIKKVRASNLDYIANMLIGTFPAMSERDLNRTAENLLMFPKVIYQYLEEASQSAWGTLNKEQKQSIKERRAQRYEKAHQMVLASDVAKNILLFLQDKVDHGENPADIAVLFQSVQHGYAFDDEHAEGIDLIGQFGNLADWFEEYGDALTEMLSGKSVWNRKDTKRKDIEKFSDRTIKMFGIQFGDNSSQQIDHRPEWIKGYLTAFSNGAQSSSDAVASAWEAWRTETSPEGNASYHQALAAGATPKEAMKAFWQIANKKQAHPKDTIVAANDRGLTLSSNRAIDWHIAALKFKANEISIEQEAKDKLIAFLQRKNVGRELLAAIG